MEDLESPLPTSSAVQYSSVSDIVQTINVSSSSTVLSSKINCLSCSDHSQCELKQKEIAKMAPVFPLLQVAVPGPAVNQRGVSQEFTGLMQSLRNFNNAMQQQNGHCTDQHFFNAQKVEYCKPTLNPDVSAKPVNPHMFVNKPAVPKPHLSEKMMHVPKSLPLLRMPKTISTKTEKPTQNEQFSFIPFKPFVPKLFKPVKEDNHNPAKKSLPLLNCQHHGKGQAFPLISAGSGELAAKPLEVYHFTSSQSDSCPSVPSVTNKTFKQHHKRSKKPNSNKIFHNRDASQGLHNNSDKAVQVNSEMSAQRSLPIQHHGLEMSRIEIKEAQKSSQLQKTFETNFCTNYQANKPMSEPVASTFSTTATSALPLTYSKGATCSTESLSNSRAATTKFFTETKTSVSEVFTDSTVTTKAILTDNKIASSPIPPAATNTICTTVFTDNTATSDKTITFTAEGPSNTTTNVGGKQVFLDVVDIEAASNESSIVEDSVASSQEQFLSHRNHEVVINKYPENTPSGSLGMLYIKCVVCGVNFVFVAALSSDDSPAAVIQQQSSNGLGSMTVR